jgi:serine/threonine protein kinase
MANPSKDQLQITHTLGSGFSGTVYACQDDAAQKKLALKVFHAVAVNRPLHQKMTQRLEAGSWPLGVMPIISMDYNARPAHIITKDYCDEQGQPRNLQFRWEGKDTDLAWKWIRDMARALANMHALQVAHGNLKPSNIFFSPDDELLLSDWALGNMPGVQHVDFTDAYLYQAPEQLLHSEGYLEEAGYRWDVYSFACLSYLLLTGEFPRCHEIFSSVAPPFGSFELEKIVADTARIAAGLSAQPNISWKNPAPDDREQEYRNLLTACLDLDPFQRPANMLEVLRRFEKIDQDHDHKAHAEKLILAKRKVQQRSRVLAFAVTMLVTCAVASTTAWIAAKKNRLNDKAAYHQELADLRSSTKLAIEHKHTAEQQRAKEVTEATTARKKAEHALRQERTTWIEQIRASRSIGDQLFLWALTKGHRDLPALDGRQARLQQLETFYQEFLVDSSLMPELAEERARAQLQLAEISLAMDDAAKASARLETAIKSLSKFSHTAPWKLRIASGQVILAMLWQKEGDARAEQGFIDAREAINALPKDETDPERMKQLLATLDFHEAKIFANKGEADKAVESIMRATTQLSSLADVKPEISFLRSELASYFLSSASILEGLGKMGDARETRALAVSELLDLLKKNPKDFSLRLALASTYAAMAETAMLAGDAGAADQHSQNAIKMLEQLHKERPEDALVTTRLASQRIIITSLLEDRGETSKALELADSGIALLAPAMSANGGEPLTQFHFARLLWEKGRILGLMGDTTERMAHFQKALDVLIPLSLRDHGDLRADHILHHIGYLHSDMAHAAQLEKNNGLAKKKFASSLAVWKQLLSQRPQHQEYRELMHWCQGRIKELD